MARSVSSQLHYTEFRPHLKSLGSNPEFTLNTVYTEHSAANAIKFVMGKRYWLRNNL